YTLASFTMNNRLLVAAIIFGLTAFFAVGLAKVELRTIFSDLFPKDHPYVQTYKDHPNFGNPLTVTMMVKVKDGTIYNPETLAKVWRMTRDIDLAPSVDHDQILSITTEKARFAEATPFGIDMKPLMEDKSPETEEEIQRFIDAVDKAPNVRTFLISEDETATIITATFIEFSLDYGETFKYVQNMVEAERDERHDVFVAGQPMLTGWVYEYEKQMLFIFSITAAALLLSLVFYMQNVPGVVTPIAVSVVAAIWGFGFVGWLGDPIEPLIMVVPLLLVARSFSHCVQFIERYYEIYYEIKDRQKAAELALGVMMAPGVLGIITDAAGLFLIAVAPIPVMERFAIFCGFWAAILVPTNMFLTPILLSYFPAPNNVATLIGKSDKKTWHDKIIGLLHVVSKVSHGSGAKITTPIVVLLAVAGVWLMLQIKVGNPVEGSNLLKESSEFNTAVRAVNSHFPGLMTLEIVFESKDEKARILNNSADAIGTMLQLQRFLEAQDPPPEATLSFSDYLPEANRLFSGGNPKWAPINTDTESINAAVNALMVGSSPKAYSHVTDFTLSNGTVSLWYKNNKQETVDTALEQTRRALDEIGIDHEEYRVRLGTGAIALQQSVNDTVDLYQWYILGYLNLVILFTCSFAYRSVAAGILLLIPVNFSNVLLASVMVLMGIGLDVNSLPIAAIGIGVGIDYGIYLLSRICEEFRDNQHHGEAITAAVTTTGKAIAFTATIVLLGILPWYFLSELKFLADMGLLLVMIMLINMVIALCVLPLLVYLVKPKFVEREHLIISENVDISELMAAHDAEAEAKT
ncbi:MAG: efflux RND transporter permease subunit, partial [Gammaproteobacteria bacterium]